MKKNLPLFSVLIANYNNGKYLMDAVESVRKQTYTNWEIILVDDCSTDDSHEIYKELEKNKCIHIFLNNKNMGCGYTKRRCAELASGDYCGFLDPDDELLPNALELMVNTHQNNPNVSIIFSRNYICDLNMNILYTSRHLSLPQGVSYLENNDFESEAFVSYTKKAYLSTNGISANYYAGVDAELNFLLEEVGDLYILNEVTYKYRRYKIDSITANKMTASYYNFMIRLDAYNRRKIKNVQNIFYAYEQCVNMVVDNRLDIQQRKIRSSKAYRLGRLLLTPFKFFNFL